MSKSEVLQLLEGLKLRAESADDEELSLIKSSAKEVEDMIAHRRLAA